MFSSQYVHDQKFCTGTVQLSLFLGSSSLKMAGLFNGAPERIRTSDLCLRRATLYPAELRALYEAHIIGFYSIYKMPYTSPANPHSADS